MGVFTLILRIRGRPPEQAALVRRLRSTLRSLGRRALGGRISERFGRGRADIGMATALRGSPGRGSSGPRTDERALMRAFPCARGDARAIVLALGLGGLVLGRASKGRLSEAEKVNSWRAGLKLRIGGHSLPSRNPGRRASARRSMPAPQRPGQPGRRPPGATTRMGGLQERRRVQRVEQPA